MNNNPDITVSRETLDSYHRKGFISPVRAFSEEQAATYMGLVNRAEIELDLMNSDYRCKSNVLFPWVDEISRNPVILAHVAAIIGPNFSCWDTLFWLKYPKNDKFVSWHQDATYWNFKPKEAALTVWVSFNGASEDMGPVEYVVGSHNQGLIHHSDIKSSNNLLMRGQTCDLSLQEGFVEQTVEAVPCQAGEFLMHSGYVMHGSKSNTSDRVRAACGMIFVATHAKPILANAPESTRLVSGVDSFNYMLHDPAPVEGQEERNKINWRAAYDRQHANYYDMQQEV